MSFNEIVNICFILYVKRGKTENMVFPDVSKQLGKTWNYIVVCCDDELNGIYKGNPEIIPHLRLGDNKGKSCYRLPFKYLTRVKGIEDLDPNLPLGKYILGIVNKIRKETQWKEE